MKIIVMIKSTPKSEAGVMPDEALLTAMGAYNEALSKAGILKGGEGLHPTSKGKRVRISGETREISSGPFTGDLVAGFWIWEVSSMEQALEWASRCPHPMPGETAELELRPIFEADDFGEALTPELRQDEERLRDALKK